MTPFALAPVGQLGIGLGAQGSHSIPRWLVFAGLALVAGWLVRHRRTGLVFVTILVIVLVYAS